MASIVGSAGWGQAAAGTDLCRDPAHPVCRLGQGTRAEDPSFEGAALGEASGVSIEAGADKELGKLQLQYPRGLNRYTLTLTAPVPKASTDADLVSLDGLSDSLNAKLAYARILGASSWFATTAAETGDQTLIELHRFKLRQCRALLDDLDADVGAISPTSQIGALFQELAKLWVGNADPPEPLVPTEDRFEEYLGLSARQYDDLSAEPKRRLEPGRKIEEKCTETLLLEGWEEHRHPAVFAVRARTFVRRPRPILGLEAQAGRKGFEFADPNTLAKRSQTEVGNAFGLTAGLLFPRLLGRDTLLLLTVRHERAFKDRDRVEICKPRESPVAGTTVAECQDLPLGAPREEAGDVYALELRHFFSQRLGIAPRLFYKEESAVTGLDLPLYFLGDGKNALNGGVRLSWRSDPDDVGASVFVGKTLQLFP